MMSPPSLSAGFASAISAAANGSDWAARTGGIWLVKSTSSVSEGTIKVVTPEVTGRAPGTAGEVATGVPRLRSRA